MGWVEEILELNYKVLKTVVLLYSWVKANYNGSSAIIKHGEYGFTLVNFSSSLIPISNASFAFPFHVKQVFFALNPKERGWKVVICKDPRGRCISDQVQIDLVDIDMFRINSANEYNNLQAPIIIPEAIQPIIVVGGSVVHANEMVTNDANEKG